MRTLKNVPYHTFADALTKVAAHASREKFLPAILGVRFEGGPGHLMLVATDQYSLIAHRMEVPGTDGEPAPDLTGVSGLWAVADIRRALTALKPGRREYPTMRVEFHGHYSTWSTDAPTPDGVPALSVPVPSGVNGFPKWRSVIASAIADVRAPGDRSPFVKVNPALLARVPGSETVAHASSKPGGPNLYTVGTSTVILVMPLRQQELDMGGLAAWEAECPPVAAESVA